MSDNPPPTTAEALQRAVRDLGRRVSENPDRVRAVLSDGMGTAAREHRAEIDALALASEEGIPATLMDRGESLVTEADRALEDQRLLDRLRERGLDTDAATFAIGAWALALGSTSTLSSTSTPGLAATGPSFGAGVGAGSLSDPADATELPPSPVADTVDAPPPEPPTDDPATARRFIPMVLVRRGVVVAAVAAVLAVVVGTAWVSFLGDDKEPALVVGGVSRTSTTSTSTSGPSTGPTTASTGTATTAKTTPTSTPATKASTPKPARTTPRKVASATPARTTPKKSTSTSPRVAKKSTPPPVPKTLRAGNRSVAWTPHFYDSGTGICSENPGPHNAGNVCDYPLSVSKSGTVTSYTIQVKSTSSHGHAVSVRGSQIIYDTMHNGYAEDVVTYRLVGGGVTSNWATISTTVYCNQNYACE